MEIYEPLNGVKKCPFCGQGGNIAIMTEEFFRKVDSVHDGSLIDIECRTCKVAMRDYNTDEHDYWKRREDIIRKWNMRGGRES